MPPNNSPVELSLEDALAKVNSAISQQQVNNAEALAKQIITQVPENPNAYYLLYKVLNYQQKYLELTEYTQRLLSKRPNDSLSYFTLSSAFRFMRQPKKAITAIEQAVTWAPDNIMWRHDLGIMYKEQGRLTEAKQCFEDCIEKHATFTPPYWHRSDITAQMPAHYVTKLEKIVAATTENHQKEQVVHAAYALFKHYQFINDYSQAFQYLQLGASVQRKGFNYNHQKELDEHKAIEQVFDHALCSSQATSSSLQKQGDCPIFICGLPRSGTTLAEQIISAHSLVAAGDELYELAQATQNILQDIKPKQQFPAWANELSTQQWHSIGSRYLTLTQHINTERYFTDKMPLNYKAIGLINLALPKAKIIYCHRPPMDLLLGAFKQILSSGNKYSYDLDELTDMIIAQHKLMAHWLKVMPDKIFVLDYKALINDQAVTTAALLSFLTLEMQQGCIDFHTNNRTVHTVSNAQVRKPIFSSSINAWHTYREQLTPYAIKMQKAGLTL